MKALKKLIYLMLCMLMIAAVMPSATFAADETLATFSDIPEDWSKPGLLRAIENGLLTGYNGKIMPKDFMTRAQMAAILNKSFGATKMGNLINYTDVILSKWYFKDMAIAYEMGTFVGNNGKMRPEDFITREEVFVVIAKCFNLTEGDVISTWKFMDATEISGWAKPLVASMIEEGYANGAYGKLNPKNNMTRAEFAALMNNLIKNYIRKAGTYTADYSGTLMVSAKDVILKDMTIDGDLIIGDGVGAGEVTLENVVVKGRTIIRGLAQLVDAGIDIDEEEVALGAGGVPGPNPNPQDPTPPGPNPPPVTPNTSEYGFRLIKRVGDQMTPVMVDIQTLRDNDNVNFQMVSNVYDRGHAAFLQVLNKHPDFIDRALLLNSERSSKPYAYTLAQRVLNYSDEKPKLKVLNSDALLVEFKAISESKDENATSAIVNKIVTLLLPISLKDIVNDLELLYQDDEDYVPEAFSIWTYDGSSELVKQNKLLIKDIESTIETIYKKYTINELAGKEIMMIQFGDEKVYLEIVLIKRN